VENSKEDKSEKSIYINSNEAKLFSEQTGQAILDAVDDGILLLNQQGYIRTSNRVVDNIFGYEEKRLLNLPFEKQLAKESHEDYRRNIEKVNQYGCSSSPEDNLSKSRVALTGLRSNGTRFPLEISIHIAQVEEETGFVVTLRDLSEKLELASQVKKTLKIKSAISDASLDALITINRHDKIVEWSNAAETTFGWLRDEVMGKTMNEIIVPVPLREAHMKGMKAFVETGEGPLINKRVEIDALHRDGNLFPVELGLVAIEHDGERLATAFVRDISERKKAEVELLEAKEKAEAASKTKSRFLSYMSHEIRSPLNAVLGSLALLNNRLETPEQLRLFQIARSSGENLLSVINEILDFSKIEAGHLEVLTSPVSIIDSLHRLLSVADSKRMNQAVEVLCYVNQEVPETIDVDEAKLRQILTILMDNAIKFTEQGSVEVWVGIDSSGSENTYLNIEVVDSGIGIESEMLPSVFAEFEQVDAVRDTGYGGTGLGLAIAKRFVEAMKGNISVTSQYGEGCRFKVGIPVSIENNEAETNAIRSNKTGKIYLFSQNPLLIQFIRRMLRRQVTSESFELIVVSSENHIDVPTVECEGEFFIVDSKWPDSKVLNQFATRSEDQVAIVASVWDSDFDIENSACEIFEKPLIDRDISNWLLKKKPLEVISEEPTIKLTPANNELILLVEDVEVNRVIAREILLEHGFEVHEAVNGLEAVNLADEHCYDAILMDMRMPVLNGLDATSRIRSDSKLNSTTPIIALTANAEISEIERCLAVGINEFISKPVEFEKLILIINQHIKKPSRKRRRAKPNLASKTVRHIKQANEVREIVSSKEPNKDSNSGQEILNKNVIRQLAKDTSIETLPKMLLIFCDEIKNRALALEQAHVERDLNEIVEQAHAIKSCSGTFGATQLYLITQQLECLARQERVELKQITPLIESTFLYAKLTIEQYKNFDITTS